MAITTRAFRPEARKVCLEIVQAAITGNTVVAPLPGRVVEILVKEGDEVKAGQDVIILEAMKMENAISTDYSGKVKQILVAGGESVQTNTILLEIE